MLLEAVNNVYLRISRVMGISGHGLPHVFNYNHCFHRFSLRQFTPQTQYSHLNFSLMARKTFLSLSLFSEFTHFELSRRRIQSTRFFLPPERKLSSRYLVSDLFFHSTYNTLAAMGKGKCDSVQLCVKFSCSGALAMRLPLKIQFAKHVC